MTDTQSTQTHRDGPRRILATTLAILAAATLATACGPTDPPAASSHPTSATTRLTGTLNAGGATSQTAAQDAWRAGFQADNPAVTVNYDPTGSGTGQKNFASGGYTIAGSDAAIAETGPFSGCAAGSALVQIPVYISPIVVVFNLPGVGSLNLDPATLAAMFTGTITRWNDPAIAATNPGVTLPDQAITPVHRSDSSGTTENFTDYLAKTAPTAWTWKPAQAWPSTLAGESAQGTQGVHDAVTAATGMLGYIDASQAAGFGVAHIRVGDGYVAPSATAAATAVGASPREQGRAASDIVLDLDRTPTDPTAYPIVLVSYLLACGQYPDASKAALAKAYLAYVVSDSGQKAAAANAGSAPLSPDLARADAAAIATIR